MKGTGARLQGGMRRDLSIKLLEPPCFLVRIEPPYPVGKKKII